jgi:putative tryptophan/tyrosine transport system substrate-binding protein
MTFLSGFDEVQTSVHETDECGQNERVMSPTKRNSSQALTRRRLLAAGIAWPTLVWTGAARAQATKSPLRVGYLSSQLPDYYLESFRQRLGELGYVDGKSVSIDTLDMDGRIDQAERLVLELAARKPNVIVLVNVASMNAAKKLGLSLPFVVQTSLDPVETGFAASLSRPGGNFTGIANLQRALSAKRLEAIRDLLPKISELAILWDANGPGPKVAAAEYEAAVRRLNWRFLSLPIRGPKPDLEGAFQQAVAKKAGALVIVSNPLMASHRKSIAALATRYRVPLIGEHEYWAGSSGVLFTYGANFPDIGRRMAHLVHLILQGAKPGDLPFEQPTRFDWILNEKTAKALGITIPRSVLVRADRVIE